MNEDISRLFYNRYPALFTGQETMFAVGDGWLALLDSLFADIEQRVCRGEMPAVRISLVKAKFAELRIHCSGGNDETGRLIAFAVEKARVTCEACGSPGRLISLEGIHMICCPAHEADERRQYRVRRGHEAIDYAAPDAIKLALLQPKFRRLSDMAEIFGLERLEEEWSSLEQTPEGEARKQQVRGILGTLKTRAKP